MAAASPTSTECIVLAGGRVVLPTGTVENGRVIVASGRIAGSAPGGARELDLTGHWVVPGFVDMHCHGGGGSSFGSGSTDEVLRVVRAHREHGTTTIVA